MAAGHGCLAGFQGTECLLSLHRILVILVSVTALSLSSAASSGAGTVTLSWTAPGEDSLCGRAYRYDLRFSEQPITPQTFQQATPALGLPAPAAPGTIQSYALEGLKSGVTYYFAIKTVDAAGNWSAISNVLSGEIREVSGQPIALQLAFSPPRPNPAREQTSFRLALPSAAPVRVEIFDVTGRRVRRSRPSRSRASSTSSPTRSA